jgi:hypothetical protein
MSPHRAFGGIAGLLGLLSSCTFLTDTSGLAREFSLDGGAPGDGSIDAPPACTDTRADSLNCGRCGHSCFGDQCIDGACQITPLATGQAGAFSVDVDDASVYWSNTGSQSLVKIDKNATNGVPTTLLQKPQERFLPTGVRVDGAYVAVVDQNTGNGTAPVYRVNKTTGGPAGGLGGACAIDGNGGIAIDADYVYFVNGVSGSVYHAAKGSGTCEPIVNGQAGVARVVVDDTSLFITNKNPQAGSSGIMRSSKGGGTPTAIAMSSVSKAFEIVADGTTLFASTPDGRIVRVNKDGSGFAELATGQPGPFGLAVDDSSVYWVDNVSGEVWATDKVAGQPRLIAANQQNVQTVAVDRDRIYWATDTSIMRIAK